MCWVYDGFIIFRKIIPHTKRFRDIEDLFYWLCMTAQIFYLLLTRHRGEIRSYIVVGMISGSLLYMKIIRPVYQTLMLTVLSPVRWCVKKLSLVFKKKTSKHSTFLKKKLTKLEDRH